MRTGFLFFIILLAYAVLVLGMAFVMPLRLGEILEAAALLHFSWSSFFAWIAHSPGGAPLGYLAQVPLAVGEPDSRFLLRIPTVVFAVLSVFFFFALTKRVPLRHPSLALLLFLMVPTHLAYATQGRPYELGLCLMLLAALCFFWLLEKPGFFKALGYTILLSGCLYTQPSCYLPAVGWLLYLLGFANLKNYRRALWYALAASVLSLAAYAPYYAWAGVQRRGDWLDEQFPAYAVKVAGLEAFMSADPQAGNPWFGMALLALLLLGLVGGIAAALPLGAYPDGASPPPPAIVKRRAVIFCLAGGAIVTLLAETAVSGWTGGVFAPYQILWALPCLIVVFCAALDALVRQPFMKRFSLASPALCLLAVLLCIPGDVDYVRTEPADVANLSALVRPQLTGDACVVFVSEKLSRYLFEVFDPGLADFECQNFFHRRIVLAIHPYVKPETEREARIYFRGLEFEETQRARAGGGQVITLQSRH